MTIEQAKKGQKILEQISNIQRYKDILLDKECGRFAHFELCQHYGNDPDKVVFDKKYTPRFISVVEEIIKELESELAAI